MYRHANNEPFTAFKSQSITDRQTDGWTKHYQFIWNKDTFLVWLPFGNQFPQQEGEAVNVVFGVYGDALPVLGRYVCQSFITLTRSGCMQL